MPAPTLISVTATVYNTTTNPKATASIAVQTGDILIAFACVADARSNLEVTISTTAGTDPTWVQRQENQPNTNAEVYTSLWSGVAAATENITITFTRSASSLMFGGEVHVWRDSDGLGNTAQNDNGTGADAAPTVNITTTQDNSGLSVGVGDWNATTGTPTFTSTAGTPTERTDFADGVNYAVHTATYADVSGAGAKTVGMSAPATQRYHIMVAEIKGTAAAPITQLMGQAVL